MAVPAAGPGRSSTTSPCSVPSCSRLRRSSFSKHSSIRGLCLAVPLRESPSGNDSKWSPPRKEADLVAVLSAEVAYTQTVAESEGAGDDGTGESSRSSGAGVRPLGTVRTLNDVHLTISLPGRQRGLDRCGPGDRHEWRRRQAPGQAAARSHLDRRGLKPAPTRPDPCSRRPFLYRCSAWPWSVGLVVGLLVMRGDAAPRTQSDLTWLPRSSAGARTGRPTIRSLCKWAATLSDLRRIVVRDHQVVEMTINDQAPHPKAPGVSGRSMECSKFLEAEIRNKENPIPGMGVSDPRQIILRARFDPDLGYPAYFLRHLLGRQQGTEWEVVAFESLSRTRPRPQTWRKRTGNVEVRVSPPMMKAVDRGLPTALAFRSVGKRTTLWSGRLRSRFSEPRSPATGRPAAEQPGGEPPSGRDPDGSRLDRW